MARLSPSFHCPWLSVVAVWWPLVRFRRAILFVCLFAKLLFLGAQRRAAPDLGGLGKALDGSPLLGPGRGPQPQKPRSWRGKPPVLRVQFGHSVGPFRQKRRLFGRAATKTTVRSPSAMVLEVFESARRQKCHVTASLRDVRRLKSARTHPQKRRFRTV